MYENEINEVVKATFERLVKMYHNPEKSLLIIPKYHHKELRISEQEARFALILELEKQGIFYFSVETPTDYAYSDFSTDSPQVYERATGKGMSGQHDVSIYEPEKIDKIINIEFKSHQPVQKSITKDILKLYFEEAEGVWVHLLQHSDSGTLSALVSKLNEAIEYAKIYPMTKPKSTNLKFYIIILEKDDSNSSKPSRCLHCTIDASIENININELIELKLSNSSLNSDPLRRKLAKLAKNYAQKYNYAISYSSDSAVIYEDIAHNFEKESFEEIKADKDYSERLEKPHTKVTKAKEMQSSNSSDALLMNIFCHPKIKVWKGIAQLFGLQQITKVEFGHKAKLMLNGVQEPTPTEIDMVLNDEILCESKLTESDFTSKDVNHVMKYDYFNNIFDADRLSKSDNKFNNYQLIRNIIAAHVEKKRFVLICHKDRVDLVKEFENTVVCIKDINLRQRCSIIYWQDIAKVVGENLKTFLQEKYGL